MNTNQLPRYVLLAAIAAVGFMLLTEWVQFRDEYKRQQVLATAVPAAAAAVLPAPITSLPTTDSAEIPLMPAAPDARVPVTAGTANQTALVRLRSDVLDLTIDLNGGDIVRATLPQHLARLDTPDQPFVLLDNSQALNYIAQSGLVGPHGTDTSEGRPLFSSAATAYNLSDEADQVSADLYAIDANGNPVHKRFTLLRGDYLVHMEYRIDNRMDSPWQAALYGQLKRDNSRDPSAEDGRFGVQPFLGVASTTNDERFIKVAFDKIPKENFQTRKTDGWIAIIQHYFLGAWIAEKGSASEYSAVQIGDFNYARFTQPVTTVLPGEQGRLSASLYLGPKDQYRLEEIVEYLDLSVDYGFLWWMAQPLFWLLNKLHDLFGNWGFAIIGLTVLIKLAFFKLSAASYRSMANMRRVQPKLVELKERFGDDKQKMSQAMMELYRKEKINPLGGCLPILVQMPVFIALYWVLLESVELRHAPFIGYIQDLSAMDPYFILPLIMGASMFFQQKLNPPPPDPMQAKVMQWLPVIFTFFFLWFPSGLVLYWVVNNLLSIAQQWVITRNIEKAAAGL